MNVLTNQKSMRYNKTMDISLHDSANEKMKMIAEGYYAVRSIVEMNKKFKVDMPICDSVYRVLYEGISPMIEMRLLSNQLT